MSCAIGSSAHRPPAAAHCVRNDVRLSRDEPIAVVSGSNMSGKSTLLRAVGVAAAMAQAGAPVRAGALALTPLSLAASLRGEFGLAPGTKPQLHSGASNNGILRLELAWGT